MINSFVYDENFNSYCSHGALHSKDSLFHKKPLKSYEHWIRLINGSGDDKLFEELYVKKE